MTDQFVSHHDEMVKHLRRHTELRRKAAEEAARRAAETGPEGEVPEDAQAGV